MRAEDRRAGGAQDPVPASRKRDCGRTAPGNPPASIMVHASSSHPRIAQAFLALADDPGAPPPQRTVPRVLGAVAATLVLAVAGPVAWASSPRGEPRELPAAAQKASAPSPEDDGDADDPRDDPPGVDTLGAAVPWAATNA